MSCSPEKDAGQLLLVPDLVNSVPHINVMRGVVEKVLKSEKSSEYEGERD